MTTDFRALCAELLRSLENYPVQPPRDRDLCFRARAALAEQPVGPTRKEAVDLYSEVMATHDCKTLGEMTEHFARAARRPKPPSLKEQALSELNLTADSDGAELSRTQVDLIRCALEQLSE